MSFLTRIRTTLWHHKWKSLTGLIGLLAIGLIARAAMTPAVPEYLTEVAAKGDIVQTVEAVGTVISEKDLALQFRSSGIVSGVFVKEGDRVRSGQKLATLRAGNLSASIASAAARAQEMEAQLRMLQAGSRQEDIAVYEANLANKKASLAAARSSLETSKTAYETSKAKLDSLKQEANTALAGQVALAPSTANQKLTTAEQAMASIDDIFSQNDVQDAVVREYAARYNDMRVQQQRTKDALTGARSLPSPAAYRDAFGYMDQSSAAIRQVIETLTTAYNLINDVHETPYFTASDRETHKTTLSTKRSSAQTALSDIESWSKSLRDSAATYDTRITAEEGNVTSAKGSMDRAQSDILTYESAVRIEEAQLQLKKAPARPQDIAASEARWRAARADLARASADYADTVITAPTDGVITKVEIKAGEITPIGAAINMLGSSPYRIEMFVSEIDIPKVLTTQTGSIELDAFRGTNFKLRVAAIDEAPTVKEGVPKYRIKLDFQYPHDELKIGMTGDAEITTGKRQGVVYVPRRAVLDQEEGEKIVRILGADNTLEERLVVIGMEGASGDVEVVSGVNEGEVVVVLVKK